MRNPSSSLGGPTIFITNIRCGGSIDARWSTERARESGYILFANEKNTIHIFYQGDMGAIVERSLRRDAN